MDRPELYHIVKKTEVRRSRNGRSAVQFAEGTKVPRHVAYEYGLIDTAPNSTVRPDEKRSEGAAPENRMETAPASRDEKADDEKPATGGKKKRG